MTLQRPTSKSSRSSRSAKRRPGSRRRVRRPRRIALAKIRDDLSRYLRLAANEEILITRHGRPAGVLIGFESENDWFEYQLENHPELLRRVEAARAAIRAGEGVRLEGVPE
jgi:prevent-host-death family protein